MAKELIIQTSAEGADIALLEDRRLMELHHDNVAEDYMVGDIYIGRIRKLISGLNAAFVDIGHEKDAFLHYHDLGPDVRSFLKFTDLVKKGKLRETRLQNFRFEPEIVKTGKIDEVLQANVPIVVQIVKEPIGTKGPRLTSQLSLPGRYLILIPFSDSLSLSKKIEAKAERDRLKKIISGLRPKNFGIIVRTNAEEATVEDLDADLRKLLSDWDSLVKELAEGKSKLYSEVDKTVSILRDLLNSDFQRITVDNPKIYRQIKKYVGNISPEQEEMVKLYKGDKPVFEAMDVDRQIKSLFNKIVNLGGGSYLIIEHTEAMHVVDVNSGSKRIKNDDQEDTALRTNLEAASEIARQLRLRDMGGIIVIDFIDMKKPDHRKQVFDRMRDVMQEDRAKHTILPLSKFGLLQITRQRARPEMNLSESQPCPVCNGTGFITKGVTIDQEIEGRLQDFIRDNDPKRVTVRVHPFLYAFFTKGLPSHRMRWLMKYRMWINIEAEDEFLMNQYVIE